VEFPLEVLKGTPAGDRHTYCFFDIIPPLFLIQVWDAVGPTRSSVVNQSLIEGLVPSYFNHALVQPLFRPLQSTETALLKVTNDLFL